MKIYNTFNRVKEELVPIEKNKYKIYVCGPTVYNLIHIGNARPMCVFDTFRKYLEYLGNDVLFVQNFTDIDDKIIKKANEENVDFKVISEKYIEEYEIDAKGLNVKPASIKPKATETIEEIILFIENLLKKGFAYKTNSGDVYFKSSNFKNYGKLSNINFEELESDVRIESSKEKIEKFDFVLWKAAKEGEPFWDSPFSKGRPGWHIECSSMVKKHLGDTIDIHCGGQDLIFPHHENEIAQSECCNDKKYVNYWMHNGYINVDNTKMSKSLNNFFTIREVAKKYGYEAIRFLMISSHYRSPINYSLDSMEQSVNALKRLINFRKELNYQLDKSNNSDNYFDITNIVNNFKENFKTAMNDDLNTADALASIFDFVRDVNKILVNNILNKSDIEIIIKQFDEFCYILGILQNNENKDVDKIVLELINKREEARKNKNYSEADKIRNELLSKGIILKDTKDGVRYEIKV